MEWVIEGYGTMLNEVDSQLAAAIGRPATHAVVPVGVGSIAQAVTQHSKSAPGTAVITVEPTTAACLRAALERGAIVRIQTGETIMCGMNCGTVSTTAWEVLRSGVDYSAVVTDEEAHQSVKELEGWGVRVGPCGAATVAALRKAVEGGAVRKDSVVILFCTEGVREYAIPA